MDIGSVDLTVQQMEGMAKFLNQRFDAGISAPRAAPALSTRSANSLTLSPEPDRPPPECRFPTPNTQCSPRSEDKVRVKVLHVLLGPVQPLP